MNGAEPLPCGKLDPQMPESADAMDCHQLARLRAAMTQRIECRDSGTKQWRDLFTAGAEQKPTKPSNIAKVVTFRKGDVEAGFNEADVVVEGRYTTPPVHQGYITPGETIRQLGRELDRHGVNISVHGPDQTFV